MTRILKSRGEICYSMNNNKINCFQCKHYYITWSKSFPKGCRFFGFKTYKLPSTSVFESSGEICRGFTQKKVEKEF